MPDPIALLAARHDRYRAALQALAAPVPGTRGLNPGERANRLRAELERRIGAAREALEFVEWQPAACTAYPLNGCAHPQFCPDVCRGRPYA